MNAIAKQEPIVACLMSRPPLFTNRCCKLVSSRFSVAAPASDNRFPGCRRSYSATARCHGQRFPDRAFLVMAKGPRSIRARSTLATGSLPPPHADGSTLSRLRAFLQCYLCFRTGQTAWGGTVVCRAMNPGVLPLWNRRRAVYSSSKSVVMANMSSLKRDY